MPPRFPHGLVRPTSKMDKTELAVFAVLGASVSVGLYRMGSDVLSRAGSRIDGGGETNEKKSDNDRRERALNAIAKCEVELNKFGECARDSGMLVLFKCRDLNARIKDCMTEQDNASPRTSEGT
jgi:hypothetical protein